MSAYLEIPLYTFQDNSKTADRLRKTTCAPLYFAMLGKELWSVNVLRKCSTLSSKRNCLILHKIQIELTRQSSSQFYKVVVLC